MPMKALLEGNAGTYRLHGAIWELGASAYRAYVHLVPVGKSARRSRSVVSAEGSTLQHVLGAAQAQVKSAVGSPVKDLEVISPELHAAPPPVSSAPRRYPAPTD